MLTEQKTAEKTTAQTVENLEKYVPPFTDIYKSKEGYHITLDMPGVAKENIKLKVENDELIVTGKINKPAEEPNYINREIFFNGYHRHFILPNDVDVEKIEASYANGVLKLFLHKKEEFKPKIIEIK